MGSLSGETSTSAFAVTFVRKRYFLPVSVRSDTPHQTVVAASHIAACAQAFECIFRLLVLSACASF
jgi:hypothetical protein